MKIGSFITFQLSCFILHSHLSPASPVATLHSRHLVPGETAFLTIEFPARLAPGAAPAVRGTDAMEVSHPRSSRFRDGNRRLIQSYNYRVSSSKTGIHQLPGISYSLGGQRHRLSLPSFQVHGHDTLRWKNTEVQGFPLSCATALFLPKATLYAGETIPAEFKLYLPESFPVIAPKVPDIQKTNLSAWRFEPGPPEARGRATLSSRPYFSYTYRSALSPLRPDVPTRLGPGAIQPVIRFPLSRNGLIAMRALPVRFEIPSINLSARKLPAPAPPEFHGAIGQFTLSSQIETSAASQSNAPFTLILSVKGTGNLDTLNAPVPAHSNGWKVQPPAKHIRSGERRSSTGQVRFTQILRPLRSQTEIPSFLLTYFDPEASDYKTLRTPAIPMLATVPKTAAPLHDHPGDILGLVNPARPLPAGWTARLLPWWHLLPLLLALGLAWQILRRRVLPRFQPSRKERELASALSHIRRLDGTLFLREAGHFIETRLPENRRDKTVAQILRRRDEACYTPDSRPILKIKPVEKEHILATLRSHAFSS